MPRLISVNEFCRTFGIGRTKAYEVLKSGQLRSVKVGSRTLIDMESAHAWADDLPELARPGEAR